MSMIAHFMRGMASAITTRDANIHMGTPTKHMDIARRKAKSRVKINAEECKSIDCAVRISWHQGVIHFSIFISVTTPT